MGRQLIGRTFTAGTYTTATNASGDLVVSTGLQTVSGWSINPIGVSSATEIPVNMSASGSQITVRMISHTGSAITATTAGVSWWAQE